MELHPLFEPLDKLNNAESPKPKYKKGDYVKTVRTKEVGVVTAVYGNKNSSEKWFELNVLPADGNTIYGVSEDRVVPSSAAEYQKQLKTLQEKGKSTKLKVQEVLDEGRWTRDEENYAMRHPKIQALIARKGVSDDEVERTVDQFMQDSSAWKQFKGESR